MDLNVQILGIVEEQCFACLGKKENMDNMSNNEEILKDFQRVFKIEIVLTEGVPKYLCNVCRGKLNESLNFYTQIKTCLQYIFDYRNSVRVKLEEKIELEFEGFDDNNDTQPAEQDSSNSEYDSDDVPLSRLAKKKVQFNQKLKKIPLSIIEETIRDYRKKIKENSNCIICDFKGVSIRNLSCHMKHKHKEVKDNWCSRCNIIFFEEIENHKSLHNQMWCKFCKKNVSRCHYLEHLKTHAGLDYTCKECQKKFISQKTLEEHIAQHKNEKPFQCPNCLKSFKVLSSLEDHISLHGRYTCNDCEKHFEIPELLNSHLCSGKRLRKSEKNIIKSDLKSNENEGEEMECEEIEENTLNDSEDNNYIQPKEEIQNHLQLVKAKKIEDLMCHFCQRSYKTAYKLQKHIEGHMGIFSAKCGWCDKGFTCKSDLVNHERTHTKEKPFTCNVCGKSFGSGATLRIHLKQHTGRPEVCDICQKRFCRKSELTLHLQKHRGERPFLCTDCGKSFAQKSHLTCHLTMHSDERPFQCTVCDKRFKKKELLKHHVRLHGEKKFKCAVCFYECHKNYRLQQHMKMHEGKSESKAVICQLCNKACSSIGFLNSHMTNVHSVIV